MINPDGTWKVKAGEEFTFKGKTYSVRASTSKGKLRNTIDTVREDGVDIEKTRGEWFAFFNDKNKEK